MAASGVLPLFELIRFMDGFFTGLVGFHEKFGVFLGRLRDIPFDLRLGRNLFLDHPLSFALRRSSRDLVVRLVCRQRQ